MCNNCINEPKGERQPAAAIVDSKYPNMPLGQQLITVTLMNDFASAENAELRLQVSALTQALETQKRENQPYIKELEDKRDFYKENYEYMRRMYSPVGDALHNSVALLKRALNTSGLPEGLHDDISNFISNLKDATGSDKPEQE